MPQYKIDQTQFIGKRYNFLTILSHESTKNRKVFFLCQCDCGNKKIIRKDCILDGNTQSCGCLWIAKRCTYKTHGASHGAGLRPEYKVWTGMKQRCTNPKAFGYKHWGGRGIKVCDKWQTFEGFIEDMGQRPSNKHSIDRTNNDGDYEKSNCKWVTRDVQHKNQRLRTTHGASKDGKRTDEYRAWARIKGICGNPNHPTYKIYGGKGIKVCDEWLNNFEQFLKDTGQKPGKGYIFSLIDKNGNYEKGNCKWEYKRR